MIIDATDPYAAHRAAITAVFRTSFRLATVSLTEMANRDDPALTQAMYRVGEMVSDARDRGGLTIRYLAELFEVDKQKIQRAMTPTPTRKRAVDPISLILFEWLVPHPFPALIHAVGADDGRWKNYHTFAMVLAPLSTQIDAGRDDFADCCKVLVDHWVEATAGRNHQEWTLDFQAIMNRLNAPQV